MEINLNRLTSNGRLLSIVLVLALFVTASFSLPVTNETDTINRPENIEKTDKPVVLEKTTISNPTTTVRAKTKQVEKIEPKVNKAVEKLDERDEVTEDIKKVAPEMPKKKTTPKKVIKDEEEKTFVEEEKPVEEEERPVTKKRPNKISKKVKLIEICTGALQSPWFCNLDDFVEDARCSHVYSLKWTYERQNGMLEIKFRYQPFTNEKVAIGLVDTQSPNGWFAVKNNSSLFENFLYFNEEDDSTQIVRSTKNYFRIRHTIKPELLKCSSLGFFIYNANDTDNTLRYLFHASSKTEVCPGTCSVCLSKPDMGIPCTAESDSRWYFNKQYGKCVEFIYSGCGGNQNNFVSQEECLNQCSTFLSTTSAEESRSPQEHKRRKTVKPILTV